MIMTGSNVV